MKDYEHIVIWLDYFNKNLKKSKGRRLGLEKCVFDPSLKELMDATKEAGYEITLTTKYKENIEYRMSKDCIRSICIY